MYLQFVAASDIKASQISYIHSQCQPFIFWLQKVIMTLQLFIPECKATPVRPFHLPAFERPLKLQIEGPTFAIEKLLPATSWQTDARNLPFSQPAGLALADVAFQAIYGQKPGIDDAVVRDEYLEGVVEQPLRCVCCCAGSFLSDLR